MEYFLPKKVSIAGSDVEIRYDFRVMMDIFEVLAMDDLSEQEKIYIALSYFYPSFPELPDAPTYQESTTEMFKFMNGGKVEKNNKKQPKLVSWADDFPYICSAVNRILGYDCRGIEYDPEANTNGVHWWTFLGAYMEIGECFFSQIVSIRSKKQKGTKLDKADQKFYNENREIIDVVTKPTASDVEWLNTIL